MSKNASIPEFSRKHSETLLRSLHDVEVHVLCVYMHCLFTLADLVNFSKSPLQQIS